MPPGSTMDLVTDVSTVNFTAPDNVTVIPDVEDICEVLERSSIPSAQDYLDGLYAQNTAWLVVTVLALFCSLLIIGLWIEQLRFLQRNYAGWKLKPRVTWILGVHPVIAASYTLGIYVPRTAVISDLIVDIYLAVVLHEFCQMIVEFHGGTEDMAQRLRETHLAISSVPLCCCPCAPKPLVTRSRIRLLQFLVLQYAVIRPLLTLIFVVAALNSGTAYGSLDHSLIAQILTITDSIAMVATLTAVYGMNVLYRTTMNAMSDFYIRPKFAVLKLVLVAINFQGSILDFLASSHVIPCSPPLDSHAAARRLQMTIVVFELLLITVLARQAHRRKMNTTELRRFSTDNGLTSVVIKSHFELNPMEKAEEIDKTLAEQARVRQLQQGKRPSADYRRTVSATT